MSERSEIRCPRFFPRFFYFSRTIVAQALTWCFGPVWRSFSAISAKGVESTMIERAKRERRFFDGFLIFRYSFMRRNLALVLGPFWGWFRRFSGEVMTCKKWSTRFSKKSFRGRCAGLWWFSRVFASVQRRFLDRGGKQETSGINAPSARQLVMPGECALTTE